MTALLDLLQDGKKHRISRADYETFLDALPPVCLDIAFQGETWDFGFAEGADPLRLFKREGQNYYAIETPYLNPYEVGEIEIQKHRWRLGWIEISRKTRGLRRSRESLFSPPSFEECGSDLELLTNLRQSHWPPGQAFFEDNLCFINLDNERGEWLAIKEGTALETISFRDIIDSSGMSAAHKAIDDLRAFRIIHLRKSDSRSR